MLLDIGVGILLGVWFDSFSSEYSLWVFVLFGAFSALSPDLDYLYHLLSGGNSRDDHRHRELLHQPLFLLVGWILVSWLTSPVLAWLFVAGASSHFLHDSIGLGWGVQWLAPLKTNHYTFLYRLHTTPKPKPPKKLIYSWPNKDLDKLQEKYGDPNWFENVYKKWHPFAVTEMAVFVLSLLVLWLYAS